MYKVGDKVYFKGCMPHKKCIPCRGIFYNSYCAFKKDLLDSGGGVYGVVVQINFSYLKVLLSNGEKVIIDSRNVIIKNLDDKFEQHKQRLLNA